jgi:hypothetical protein
MRLNLPFNDFVRGMAGTRKGDNHQAKQNRKKEYHFENAIGSHVPPPLVCVYPFLDGHGVKGLMVC